MLVIDDLCDLVSKIHDVMIQWVNNINDIVIKIHIVLRELLVYEINTMIINVSRVFDIFQKLYWKC